MKHNAITEQDKLARRAAFIATARRLFLTQQRLPNVADIAAAAGLAKGTVYRYFRSKDEIFIALLQDDFAELFSALAAAIPQLPKYNSAAATAFAVIFSQQLQQRPTLLPLAAMLTAVLEHNLPLAVLKQFKQMLSEALQQLGQAVAAHLGGINQTAAAQLLLHSYGLTLGLWQALQYPPSVQALLQASPELSNLQRDFDTELTAAIARLWRGAWD
jgi:AcrR family transcriptional regulator